MAKRRSVEFYAKKYGVPIGLAKALIGQESGGRDDAESPAGAVGRMQIHLPSHPNVSAAQARDPDFAMDYGFKLLSGHYRKYKKWSLALAAYNAGPGRVDDGSWRNIDETRTYVRNILKKAGTLGTAKPQSVKAPLDLNGAKQFLAMDPLKMAADVGLSSLAAGKYDPTEQLGELSSAISEAAQATQLMGGTQGGGGARQAVTRGSAAVQPGEWQDWVEVPKARGGPSQPHGEEILQFVGAIGQRAGQKLAPWDNTTHSRNTVNGRESAHFRGNAADIPASGKHLRELGYHALVAAGMSEKKARAAARRGGLFNVGGYQIIFATNIGGNHHDHLHVGIRR